MVMTVRLVASAFAGLVSVCWLTAGQVQAQGLEQDIISEEGTQFVTEPEPPSPPAVEEPVLQPQPAPPPPPAARRAPPSEPAKRPRYPAVVILLDTSDSMLNRAPGGSGTLLLAAKSALKQVVEGMSDQTRAQIWAFNTRLHKLKMPGETRSGFVRVGRPGSRTRERLIQAIDKLKTAGGTNLYQAIIRSLEIFAERRDQAAYRSGERFPVLVVISDGEDWGKSRYTLDSVLKAKEKFPLVTVNTIGFNISRQDKWFADLCRIATHPQGCAPAGDRGQLQAILESFYRYRPPAS